MPCGDVTEKIRLVVGHDDSILSYSFAKKTCGGAIGLESLISDYVIGQNIDSFIDISDDYFLKINRSYDDVEEFLKIKHFHAVQTVIRTYLGLPLENLSNQCEIIGIEYGEDSSIINAEISIKLQVEKIDSCEHCGPG